MSVKRKQKDLDYYPEEESESTKKIKKLYTEKSNTFCNQHAGRILELNAGGKTPTQIAAILNIELGFKKGEKVLRKQIADWINYRKKSNQIKTKPVSLKNNNLRVEKKHSCMWEFK